MRATRAIGLGALVLSIGAGTAHAQLPGPSASQIEAIDRLAHWVGEWAGTGWALTGPNARMEFSITQSVGRRINGSVLLMQGRWVGNEEQPRTDEALSVLSFDPVEDAYRLRTYDLQGLERDSDFRITENGAEWGFRDERTGGLLRFVIEVGDGRWQEAGEFSPDGGNTWFRILEMSLNRSDGAGGP